MHHEVPSSPQEQTPHEPYSIVTLDELVYAGSSQNLFTICVDNELAVEILAMQKADYLSVGDLGRETDVLIDGKGLLQAALTFGAFKELESLGIRTHLVGGVAPNNFLFTESFDYVPSRTLIVNRCKKPKLVKGDTVEKTTAMPSFRTKLEQGNKVIVAVEFIYRAGLGPFSSVTKDDESWATYLGGNFGRGLPETRPTEYITLEQPLVDLTTKFEDKDRPLSKEQVRDYVGFDEATYQRFIDFGSQASQAIIDYYARFGIVLPDLKIEIAAYLDEYGILQFMVADGTGPDESRWFVNPEKGLLDISKQLIRECLNNSNWGRAYAHVKKHAEGDWKATFLSQTILDQTIKTPKIIDKYLRAISQLYKTITKTITADIRGEIDEDSAKYDIERANHVFRVIKAELESKGSLIVGDITAEQADEIIAKFPTTSL
jgi:phosphoribosylaminoimidazole-succinocarboxamide synthase